MARASQAFQVSILVDISGGSPFRAATLRSALAVRQACRIGGIDVQFLVHRDAGDPLVNTVSEGETPDGWLASDPRSAASLGFVHFNHTTHPNQPQRGGI